MIEKFVFVFVVLRRQLLREYHEYSHLVGTWADARSWLQKKADEIRTQCPTNITGFNHNCIQTLAFRLPDGYQDKYAETSLNNLAKFYLQ